MPRLSKRTKANAANVKVDPVGTAEAVAALRKFKATKFDQTVNICMHLGVDPAHADQSLRGSISLPKGIGKTKRVIAFCQSDIAPKALAAGAVKAGGDELVAEIEKGWMDFDVAIASPDMMRVVSKLGKVLGPKGLMPSPKAGTVTPQVAEAVKEYSAGKVEYRTDKGGNVHAVVGKLSFADTALVENIDFFIKTIEKVRPSTVKGIYIKKVVVSGAMTPSVQVKYVTAVVAAE
jgi:large subunit ribosomal protein L1